LPQHDRTADSSDADIREQVTAAATAAGSKKATDVVLLEVGPLVGITDFFLLLSAQNDRQLNAALEAVEEALRTQHGRRPIGREGQAVAGWVVLDYGDYVVHGFTTAQREVYDLERLWRDAPRTVFEDAPA
jgi:ribosome-associated protein